MPPRLWVSPSLPIACRPITGLPSRAPTARRPPRRWLIICLRLPARPALLSATSASRRSTRLTAEPTTSGLWLSSRAIRLLRQPSSTPAWRCCSTSLPTTWAGIRAIRTTRLPRSNCLTIWSMTIWRLSTSKTPAFTSSMSTSTRRVVASARLPLTSLRARMPPLCATARWSCA